MTKILPNNRITSDKDLLKFGDEYRYLLLRLKDRYETEIMCNQFKSIFMSKWSEKDHTDQDTSSNDKNSIGDEQ